MKLIRSILPIFFFFLSLGAVGQKDCKCFWVVLDEGIEYKQPVFPEKTNNYEADGFKSLREW